MKPVSAFLAILLCLGISTQIIAADKTAIGVLDFKNSTGSESLNFLASSLAAEAEKALTADTAVRAVERSRLKEILNEKALQQSGLFDTDTLTANSALIPAEYLLLGEYSGSSAALIVTLKLVNVANGEIAATGTIRDNLENSVNKVKVETARLLPLVTSEATGLLTVISDPEGADVYLDGVTIGTTPLKSARVPAGEHNIRVSKTRYRDFEAEVTIRPDKEQLLNPYLPADTFRDRIDTTLGVYFLMPAFDYTDNSALFVLSAGRSFQAITAGLEAGISLPLDHNYQFDVPYSQREEERSYRILYTGLNFEIYPFRELQYLSPYAGFSTGLLWLNDNPAEEVYFEKKSTLLYYIAPVLGVNILPYSTFTGFIEARYYYSPGSFERSTVESVSLFGTVNTLTREYNFGAWAIGGGFSFYF